MSLAEDLVEGTKTQIVERLSSPLLGSFVIAWSGWNYRFFVILFSDASVSKTFEMIDQIAFASWWAYLGHGLLFPLLTALAYVFFYPHPANYVYGYTLKRKRASNALRQSIEEETLLSIEESRSIRTAIASERARLRSEIEGLESENEELRAKLKVVAASEPAGTKTESEVSGALEDKKPTLSPLQFQIMARLEKANGRLSQSEIMTPLGSETRIKTEYEVGELVRRKLLSRDFDSSISRYMYTFTHTGRGAYLDVSGLEKNV